MLGNVLVIVAQAMVALQMVVEEKVRSDEEHHTAYQHN